MRNINNNDRQQLVMSIAKKLVGMSIGEACRVLDETKFRIMEVATVQDHMVNEICLEHSSSLASCSLDRLP